MIVGIDPGAKGAIAYLADSGKLVDVVDMPYFDGRVIPGQLYPLVVKGADKTATTVWCELVHAMPGQGVSSTFKFGASWGSVLTGFGMFYPTRDVRPVDWKQTFSIRSPKGLSPSEKKRHQEEQALRIANELWPDKAGLFTLKKHAGRAEAALIAEHGRRTG